MVTRPRLAACLTLLLAGTAATTANAQLGSDPVEPDPHRAVLPLGIGGALAVPGSLRLVGVLEPGVGVLSDDPQVAGQVPDESVLHARLRIRPALILASRGFFKIWRAAVDAELHFAAGEAVYGQGLDPVVQARQDAPEVRLTQAYLLAQGEHLAVRVGLVRSHFGMGILANGGEDAPVGLTRESPFGYARQGDRVMRVSVVGLPQGLVVVPGKPTRAPLALAFAADAIIDDDQARWSEGDRAWQVLGGIFANPAGYKVGAGAAHRRQTHGEGGETAATIVLASAQIDHEIEGTTLFARAEGAGYLGETDFVGSAARLETLRILSAGGALRVGAQNNRWVALVEAGLASGDANPFDAELHGFTFDRDYRVGLLLFGPATRQISAQTAFNAGDPRLRARPSRGYDNLATGGAITNARYLNPRVSVSVVQALTLHAGYVLAQTDEPYADAFQSGLAGGGAVGPRGAKNAESYGHEVDFGIDYSAFEGKLRARAQVAWASLGDVFSQPESDLGEDEADSIVGGQLLIEGRW